MKLAARLLFLVLVVMAVGSLRSQPAHAQSALQQPASPHPTELVRPKSGSDTFKLASLGVVFLVIGAAVVYAPQIVSAVSSLPRRLLGRPKPRQVTAAPQGPQVVDLPPAAPRQAEDANRAVTQSNVFADAHGDLQSGVSNSDVVARLQNEVRSAWSKTH